MTAGVFCDIGLNNVEHTADRYINADVYICLYIQHPLRKGASFNFQMFNVGM